MGFYFNGYDINGSPLTYNTNYTNVMTSWWNNANVLNGTLTISSNIMVPRRSFSLGNQYKNTPLESLQIILKDLTEQDIINLPNFTSTGEVQNFKDFSYTIDNIAVGDFYHPTTSIATCMNLNYFSNLTENGRLNMLNYMQEIKEKTNIPSYFGQLFRNSTLQNVTLKNFRLYYGDRELQNAFMDSTITNLIFENYNIEPIGDMLSLENTFYNCKNLDIDSLNNNFFSKIDAQHFNEVNLRNAFNGCSKMTVTPNLYNCIITGASEAFINTGLAEFPRYTFSNCNGHDMMEGTNLIEVSNLKYTNANFTDMYGMFSYCSNLTKINNISIKNVSNLSDLFFWDRNLSQINNLIIEGTNSFTEGFCASGIKTIDSLFLSNISNAWNCFTSSFNLSTFTNSIISQVMDMESFFRSCTNLKTLPNLDFSKTIKAKDIFYNCKNLSTDSLNYFGMVLPNRSNLTNISTYNLSYFGLTNDQINVIASNTAARISVLSKGWEISNLEPKRTRVTQFAQMNNNKLENIKIGMDAEYVTLPGGVLNFLPNETNIPTVINEMANYLGHQINAKYRAFDISFDIYDQGDYDENIYDYQYTFNQHINTRIYSDTSENGENLRNYIEQYAGYNGYNSYYIGNLNIVEISAPNFINAYNMLFGVEAM